MVYVVNKFFTNFTSKAISNSHLQSTISTVLELRSGGRVTTVPIKKLPPPPSDSGHSDGEQGKS